MVAEVEARQGTGRAFAAAVTETESSVAAMKARVDGSLSQLQAASAAFAGTEADAKVHTSGVLGQLAQRCREAGRRGRAVQRGSQRTRRSLYFAHGWARVTTLYLAILFLRLLVLLFLASIVAGAVVFARWIH